MSAISTDSAPADKEDPLWKTFHPSSLPSLPLEVIAHILHYLALLDSGSAFVAALMHPSIPSKVANLWRLPIFLDLFESAEGRKPFTEQAKNANYYKCIRSLHVNGSLPISYPENLLRALAVTFQGLSSVVDLQLSSSSDKPSFLPLSKVRYLTLLDGSYGGSIYHSVRVSSTSTLLPMYFRKMSSKKKIAMLKKLRPRISTWVSRECTKLVPWKSPTIHFTVQVRWGEFFWWIKERGGELSRTHSS